jgi:beta-glucanase (GH16 family)
MLIRFSLCLLTLLSATSTQDDGGDYELVWADEFDIDGPPDSTKWNFERGFSRNHEAQWYQPENAFCTAGNSIEARRETTPVPEREQRWGRSAAEYTSASLTTRKLESWLYGRFEMRAKIDVRPGLWPAFWTLGSARHWPGCGEIDIMEFYRGKLLANVGYASAKHTIKWDSTRTPLAVLGGAKWADEFHTWRMDWDAERIALYVDDRLLNETDVTKCTNATRDGANPFREPHYLVVNLAVGGDNGGDPSATAFPARMEVDYVRVWQKK